jgi:phosphoglycerate dehydrogenase-like enzyme
MKSALFYDHSPIEGHVFSQGRKERIADLTDLYPRVITAQNFDEHASALADVEVIFATWGMICFEDRHFQAMPKLKAVFYAAGNVRAFAQPLLDNGITLVSAWQVNAIGVAEMCLSQILLSLRGYFRFVRGYHDVKTFKAKQFSRPGVNGETIGMIGMGKIGLQLTKLLEDYPLKVIAYDPFLSAERAAQLNVELVSLEEIFSRSMVVCNHMPDLETTRGAFARPHFESMRDGATFVNTGRGAQVVESDLLDVLSARPDLTALLDVTWPEPPPEDSPMWQLPNLLISPHIGGATGEEVVRLADLATDEFEAWRAGKSLQHEVTAEIFATMG